MEALKALETLKARANEIAYERALVNPNYLCDMVLNENTTNESIIRSALLSPFDEAIKIVEKQIAELEPARHTAVCAPLALSELNEVLSALKEVGL